MRPVTVLIFHLAPPAGAGPFGALLAEARRVLAEHQRSAFLAAGADAAYLLSGPPDEASFGERLRTAIAGMGIRDGLVVLGSGSIPLARAPDLRRFVEVAAGPAGHALANNRYSADVVAVPRAADLAELPPLPADNALPRWLKERAELAVADMRSRWRLGVDLDSPADLLLLDEASALPASLRPLGGEARAIAPLAVERLRAVSRVLADRRAELLVAGRVSSVTLRAIDHGTACRTRALVEERGLRAASPLAQAGRPAPQRPPRAVVGELLDRDGPEALGRIVAGLADAAVLDTRVLLAHRFGPDERLWPSAEDRFAADLLCPSSIGDPWLRAVTESALDATIPIVLGGHTTVNGGLRLLAVAARRAETRR